VELNKLKAEIFEAHAVLSSTIRRGNIVGVARSAAEEIRCFDTMVRAWRENSDGYSAAYVCEAILARRLPGEETK
jgi:hypothetical protein